MTEYYYGEIVGFRYWRMVRNPVSRELQLLPVNHYACWRKGVNTAYCDRRAWVLGETYYPSSDPSHGIAPAGDCSCGFYAFHSPEGRINGYQGALMVHGAIKAWGEVQLHADGFRAQYAEIICLAWDDKTPSRHDVLEAATGYGVHVLCETDMPFVAAEFGQSLAGTVV